MSETKVVIEYRRTFERGGGSQLEISCRPAREGEPASMTVTGTVFDWRPATEAERAKAPKDI